MATRSLAGALATFLARASRGERHGGMLRSHRRAVPSIVVTMSACATHQMTERKPPHKRGDSWVEELIERARTEGAFDDLEGKGKPIPGLNAPYDPNWWVKKLLEREKLSVLPPALEIRAKVERALDEVWRLGREADVRQRVMALNAEIVRVNRTTAEGPPTSLA